MSTITNTQGSEAFILGLPSELMEVIAGDVQPEDLLAMRSTCRDMNDKVQRAFVETHFTNKPFFLHSPESMQALLGISQHGTFGRAMVKITLLSQSLVSAGGAGGDHWHRLHASQGTGDSREQRVTHREGRRVHQLLHEQHRTYNGSEKWQCDLAQALTNFKKLSGNIALALQTDMDEQTSMPCGRKRL